MGHFAHWRCAASIPSKAGLDEPPGYLAAAAPFVLLCREAADSILVDNGAHQPSAITTTNGPPPKKVDTKIGKIVYNTTWEATYDRDKKNVYA